MRKLSLFGLMLMGVVASLGTGCGDDDDDKPKKATGGKAGFAGLRAGGAGIAGAELGGGRLLFGGAIQSGGAVVAGGAPQQPAGGGGALGGAPPAGGAVVGGVAPGGGGALAAGGVVVTAGAGGEPPAAGGAPSEPGGAPAAGTSGAGMAGSLPEAGAAGAAGAENGGLANAGAGGIGDAGAAAPSHVYHFDSFDDAGVGTGNLEGWGVSAPVAATLSVSPERPSSGSGSLKLTLPLLDGWEQTDGVLASVYLDNPPFYPGSVVSFRIWTPPVSTILDGGPDGLTVMVVSQLDGWLREAALPQPLTRGDWSTVTYTVPPVFPGGLNSLAIAVGVLDTGIFPGGNVYIDELTVNSANATTACYGPNVTVSGREGTLAPAAQYSFESDTQGWTGEDGSGITLESSTDRAYPTDGSAGTRSLKVDLPALGADGGSNYHTVYISRPSVFCGDSIRFWIWAPDGSGAVRVHPYAEASDSRGAIAIASTQLAANTWTSLDLVLPGDIDSQGIRRLGLRFEVPAGAQYPGGSFYVDHITRTH